MIEKLKGYENLEDAYLLTPLKTAFRNIIKLTLTEDLDLIQMINEYKFQEVNEFSN